MSNPPPVIGYIVKMFPRLSETFIRNEIAELERLGLKLRVFSLKRPVQNGSSASPANVSAQTIYLPQRVWREPLRVLRAQAKVFRRYPSGYLRTLAHVLWRRQLRSLPRGLRRFSQTCCVVQELGGAGHLHAHFASDPTRVAAWAQMICGVSYSVSTHAKDLFQDNRVGSPGLRCKLSNARFVVANSQYSAAALRQSLNGHPNGASAARVCTIYNGIDLAAFAPRLQPPCTPLILSVGRLIEKKGFAKLIRACARLRERGVPFKCEIVGAGPFKAALQQEIAALDLEGRVRLRGEYAHEELLPFYQRAMVFALPCVVASNGDRDVLPNVLKEAMAVGVPVVTTRLEGIEELVTHGVTGLLVEPGDPEALAEALQQLLTDPALRQRLATAARKLVEARFDLRANFSRLKNLLTHSLEQPAS